MRPSLAHAGGRGSEGRAYPWDDVRGDVGVSVQRRAGGDGQALRGVREPTGMPWATPRNTRT